MSKLKQKLKNGVVITKTDGAQLSLNTITADGALHIQQLCSESTDKPFLKQITENDRDDKVRAEASKWVGSISK